MNDSWFEFYTSIVRQARGTVITIKVALTLTVTQLCQGSFASSSGQLYLGAFWLAFIISYLHVPSVLCLLLELFRFRFAIISRNHIYYEDHAECVPRRYHMFCTQSADWVFFSFQDERVLIIFHVCPGKKICARSGTIGICSVVVKWTSRGRNYGNHFWDCGVDFLSSLGTMRVQRTHRA